MIPHMETANKGHLLKYSPPLEQNTIPLMPPFTPFAVKHVHFKHFKIRTHPCIHRVVSMVLMMSSL